MKRAPDAHQAKSPRSTRHEITPTGKGFPVVGATGIEPVTSAVSRHIHPFRAEIDPLQLQGNSGKTKALSRPSCIVCKSVTVGVVGWVCLVCHLCAIGCPGDVVDAGDMRDMGDVSDVVLSLFLFAGQGRRRHHVYAVVE
jgi:hypothetical protein